MLSEEDRDLTGHLYSYHLALVSNAGLSEESFKKVQEDARETYEDLSNEIRPWLGKTAEERAEEKTGQDKDQMKEQWQEFFGWDLDDPVAFKEWQEDMAKTVKEAGENLNRRNADPDDQQQRLREAIERVHERRAKAHRNR